MSRSRSRATAATSRSRATSATSAHRARGRIPVARSRRRAHRRCGLCRRRARAALAALPRRALPRRGCDAGADALRAPDGGLPARAARRALWADPDVARPSRRSTPTASRHHAACSSSTSRPISPAICCSKADHRLDGALARAALAASRPSRSSRLGLALPDSLKVRGREGRSRCAARSPTLCRPRSPARGKTGFGVPLGRWFRAELRDARARPARRATAAGSGPTTVRRLLDEHAVGPRRSRPPALVPAHARALGARARRGTRFSYRQREAACTSG